MKTCNGCKYLIPQEEDQTNNKEHHICQKYKWILKHNGHHPLIPRPQNCKVK